MSSIGGTARSVKKPESAPLDSADKLSFPTWPYFEDDEIEAAIRVLRSGKVNYWTGEEGRQFESEFAAAVGCNYGVAVANGTLALELALYASGVGLGDEVIVSSRTFVASASSVVMRGAIPVMADVDRNSGTITAESVRACLTSRTRAIIAVHLAGWPCDMDPILQVAREHNLLVIEDCAQAHGALYKGRPVGSLGHVAGFSFCQDKIITTGGEGGMLTTNDAKIWERAWSYKDHGKSFEAVHHGEHAHGFRWLHNSFGTNWRLTEPQSAIGRVQLRKLSAWAEQRRRHAAILDEGFSQQACLRATLPPSGIQHSYYKYYCYVRPDRLRPDWSRDRVVASIIAEGIPCSTGSCSEIYLEKAFPDHLRPVARLPVARELGETSMMFQVHPTLRDDDMKNTCRAVEKVMASASR